MASAELDARSEVDGVEDATDDGVQMCAENEKVAEAEESESRTCTCEAVRLPKSAVDPDFFVDLGWNPVWKNFQKIGAMWFLVCYPHLTAYIPGIGETVSGLALSYQSLLKVWLVQSLFGYVFSADDTLRLGWSIGLSYLSCLRWMLQSLLLNGNAIEALQSYARIHGYKIKGDDGYYIDDDDDAADADKGKSKEVGDSVDDDGSSVARMPTLGDDTAEDCGGESSPDIGRQVGGGDDDDGNSASDGAGYG